MKRKHESLRELAAAPELAHITVVLIALDALLRALHVAHGHLDRDPPPGDAPTVVWAADAAARARALRSALLRYRAAVLRALRPPTLHQDDDLLF